MPHRLSPYTTGRYATKGDENEEFYRFEERIWRKDLMASVETTLLLEENNRARCTDFLNTRSLAASVGFNLGGGFAVICLGAVCIPYVVRRLGTDSFGVLSLAWAVMAYMSLFDMGLSRATTKFAAEAMGRGDHHQLPSLLGTSLMLQLAMGLLGGSLLFVLSSWVAESLLKIPGPLVGEAVKSFKILAIAVPVLLVSNCLRGTLEAFQRFDLINYVKVPANASMFLSPLLILPFGGRLPSIVLLMTLFWSAATFVYLRFCLSLLPTPGMRVGLDRGVLGRLLRYGGWVTISNVTGPILMYLDRFLIGILVSIGAVAYYTAPAEMVNRLLIVPASLCTILFPAFSSLTAAGERARVEDFFARSIKYLIVTLGPVLLLVAAFARDILQFWLGSAFAEHGTVALQILALGVFVNSLGFFPYSLLQGVGKPNLTGAFHLIEIPLHFALVWVLVTRMGIVGAAIASTARVLVDGLLLIGACIWLRFTSLHILRERKLPESCLGVLVLGAAIWASSVGVPALPIRIGLAAGFLTCYVIAQWHWSCDLPERQFLRAMSKEILKRLSRRGFVRDCASPTVKVP
jgi:O-antigen/teichoic acid export membrane protein